MWRPVRCSGRAVMCCLQFVRHRQYTIHSIETAHIYHSFLFALDFYQERCQVIRILVSTGLSCEGRGGGRGNDKVSGPQRLYLRNLEQYQAPHVRQMIDIHRASLQSPVLALSKIYRSQDLLARAADTDNRGESFYLFLTDNWRTSVCCALRSLLGRVLSCFAAHIKFPESIFLFAL